MTRDNGKAMFVNYNFLNPSQYFGFDSDNKIYITYTANGQKLTKRSEFLNSFSKQMHPLLSDAKFNGEFVRIGCFCG